MGGRGLGHSDGQVLFVDGGIPGDIVDVELQNKKRDYLEGRVERILQQSPARAEPFCRHFGVCGGCSWQGIAYEAQLKYKEEIVRETFLRMGRVAGIPIPDIAPVIGAGETRFFRNKLEFTFSAEGEKRALGFHGAGEWQSIVNLETCYLQREPSNAIRLALREYAIQEGIRFFDLQRSSGVLRTLIIRTTTTGETMVIVVFFRDAGKKGERLLAFLADRFPEITSLLYVINSRTHDKISSLPVYLFKGREYLVEQIDEFRFKIGPQTFFQTNMEQAHKLCHVVRDWARLSGEENVYDLYSGAGTIAIFLAPHCRKVTGIELLPSSIADAAVNAEWNDVKNATFYEGDVKAVLTPEFIRKEGLPDVVVVDPSRSGLDGAVIARMPLISPKKIIYVSCNPSTQARDIAMLATQSGSPYKISRIQPLDMFPHSPHIENVVLLEHPKSAI